MTSTMDREMLGKESGIRAEVNNRNPISGSKTLSLTEGEAAL